ncbi:hypothetical protein A3197_12645 [Candidatus Thiodiazotropha endoloripes]|nr:hypothetical protein A3197_12645 [Candidatus Thiodiazotropha endoloripes]
MFLNTDKNMSNWFYMNRFLVVPSLMMSPLMMIALPAKTEPLSWKASPTTTGGTLFNSKEEAVSDFQSKGGQDVVVIGHHGIGADIDGKNLSQQLHTIDDPLSTMFIAFPGKRIESTEKSTPDAA